MALTITLNAPVSGTEHVLKSTVVTYTISGQVSYDTKVYANGQLISSLGNLLQGVKNTTIGILFNLVELEPEIEYTWYITGATTGTPPQTWIESGHWTFTTEATKANTPTPADGAISQNRDPDEITFSWHGGFDPTDTLGSDKLYGGYAEDDLSAFTDWGVGGEYTTRVGAYGQEKFYWRMDYKLADDSIVTGDVWSFSIVPPKVNNPTPTDSEENVDYGLSKMEWTAY